MTPESRDKDRTHIEVQDVVCRYQSRKGDITALGPLSMAIAHGEFVSIVGPSGCGKTTLLKMIAGLIPASEGEIRIAGSKVAAPQTDIGFVFQDPVLLDWRSVIGNVLLQAEIRALDPEASAERARRLLASVGLSGFENRRPYELSGGMRQRASICRALVHDPPLLLMDEPFGALDSLTREQISMDLQLLWMSSHKTVVLVTHSIAEAVQLSDRVAVFTPRPGRIAEIFDIDLARPRRLDKSTTPLIAEFGNRIRMVFQAQGVLS